MTHTTRSSLYATVAISAALAFGSTTALAQEAALPSIELPPPAAPAAPPAAASPTIVLPETVTAAANGPAASPAPAPRAERAAPRPAAQSAATSASSSQSRVAASTPAPAELSASEAVAIPPAPVPMVVPDAEPAPPVAEAPQPDTVRSAVDLPDELVGAAGLGVIALGALGFVSLRRRRRREQDLQDAVYEPEPAYVAPAYVAEEPSTSIPDDLAVRRQPAAAPVASDRQTFASPRGPVPSGEARQQLIDEMVAARPDAANPFTSAKARRKRARIILQAREHEQGQASEPFDWRTYGSPATRDPAKPPLVDAEG